MLLLGKGSCFDEQKQGRGEVEQYGQDDPELFEVVDVDDGLIGELFIEEEDAVDDQEDGFGWCWQWIEEGAVAAMEHVDDGDGAEEETAYQDNNAECLSWEGEVDEQADQYEFADRKSTIEVESIDGVMQVTIDIICEEGAEAIKEYYPKSTLSVSFEKTNKEDHG